MFAPNRSSNRSLARAGALFAAAFAFLMPAVLANNAGELQIEVTGTAGGTGGKVCVEGKDGSMPPGKLFGPVCVVVKNGDTNDDVGAALVKALNEDPNFKKNYTAKHHVSGVPKSKLKITKKDKDATDIACLDVTEPTPITGQAFDTQKVDISAKITPNNLWGGSTNVTVTATDPSVDFINQGAVGLDLGPGVIVNGFSVISSDTIQANVCVPPSVTWTTWIADVTAATLVPGVPRYVASFTVDYDGESSVGHDNFIHLINGVDYFFGKAPTNGAFGGIWRCFPSEVLHAPTRDVSPSSPTFLSYATKVNAIHVTMTASPGSLISFPTIALSSSAGTCNYLTSAGTLNFGLASVAGYGTFVAGPLTSHAGAESVHFLGGISGASVPNPASAANVLTQISLCLDSPTYIGVPEHESLVLWVQDNPNQFGAGSMQYWTGSIDERNLCSGYSFLLSAGSGATTCFAPNFEWSIGLGTVDATMTTAISSLGSGPSGLNAHDASQGFSPGFDTGSGSRTISITGGSLGQEFLGIAVYDDNNQTGGSYRLAVANVMGLDPTHAGNCSTRSGTFVPLPTGGPGGPVLATTIPEMPRSVGRFDVLANALLGNAIWIASTNHSTASGSLNIPWYPSPAGVSGSNGSGSNGGFMIPLPPLPAFPGLQLYFWNWNVDPSNSFLDPTAANGHSLTNGYDVMFFP